MAEGNRFKWLILCLFATLMAFVAQIIGSLIGLLAYCMPEMRKLREQGLLTDETVNMVVENATVEGMGLCLLWAHILIIFCFALWFYYGCGRHKLREAKSAFVPKTLLVTILVAGGMCFFINFAMPVIIEIIPKSIVDRYEELMEQAGFGVDTLAIVASVLLAPFGEELACRGVIFHYAKKAVSDLDDRRKAFWIANSIQALMFGIMHANIIQGTYAFIMGLALGYLRHRYNSLAPAILAHMMINATSSFVWEPFASLFPESYVVFAICALVCLGVAFVGLYVGGPAEKSSGVAANEME